ncbi:MAG: phosphoribosylformylglycinamidine cyclo-ligase [Gammaproteobacteria bacterium]
MTLKPRLNYRDSGVHFDSAERLIERIRPWALQTGRSEVLGGIGGFGALIEIPTDRYKKPVLVAGTDGVGTKLLLALAHDRLEGIGVDLVAMCANDVLVHGAEPLFFLDYYATGRIDIEQGARLIQSIAEGCREAGCALVGGETAELPGLYRPHDFDLAGFCVGIVERDRVLDGSAVRAGDRVIGLASSGVHSNGFSLVRSILDSPGVTRPPIDLLLEPTRIYVRSIRTLLETCPVHALAHITGGGLIDNPPRVIPESLGLTLDPARWQQPAVFDWIQNSVEIDPTEFYRTFNAGIGFIVITAPEQVAPALRSLAASGEQAFEIGEVIEDSKHAVTIG